MGVQSGGGQQSDADIFLPVPKRKQPEDDSGSQGLPRLPPGRHGLPREFVVQNQRDRLVAGIIAAVADRGYHDATISEIAAAAGVSRRTFYTYFSSKEECFLATYDVIARHLAAAASDAAEPGELWPERVRAKLGAALAFFGANPDLVRFYLSAPPRAGEAIAARYRLGAIRVLADLTDGMPSEVRQPPPSVQNAMTGSIAALIVRKVEAGEGEKLPELLPDLVELFLTPYLGHEAAAKAARASS
jgi:AcrR family transcriptional regulator